MSLNQQQLYQEISADLQSKEADRYLAKQGRNLHQFYLTEEIFNTLKYADVRQTCLDLAEMGLLHLPYPAQYIKFIMDADDDNKERNITKIEVCFIAVDNFFVKDDRIAVEGIGAFYIRTLGSAFSTRIDSRTGAEIMPDGSLNHHGVLKKYNLDNANTACGECCRAVLYLLVALAVKNTVKLTSTNTRINTPKKMKTRYHGPEGAIYLSTTRLEMPPVHAMQSDPNHPAREGISPRAHLRRGHIHTFAYGSGRTERKKTWLPPIFVNADPEFVARTRAYVVK